MGLDISAYSKLTPLDTVYDKDGEPIDPITREPFWKTGREYARVYVNPDFPERADSLADGMYSYGEGTGFRAGSYSYYSRWREELAVLAGYPELRGSALWDSNFPHSNGAYNCDGGPFWELINFSDCEGAIGPETSAKLARDFAEHREEFYDRCSEDFMADYDAFEAAFLLASDGGAVCFH